MNFLGVMKVKRGGIGHKSPGGEFEKAHQKKLNKEKNRGMVR